VIRLVQDERKNAGLDVSDRISLWWQAAGAELGAALTEYGAMIAGEVLAVNYTRGRPDGDAGRDPAIREHADAELGLIFWLRRASADDA
jgi:isoleucyl-tRNA synthetase